MLPSEHHGHDHGHEHNHDKRFQEYVSELESGTAKNTLKKVRKIFKKEVPSQCDQILFRIVEAMAHQRLNENTQAEKCLVEIAEDILKLPHFDGHVITAFLYTVKISGLSQLSMDTLEKLYKKHPKSEELAESLFAEYLAANNFLRLNLLSKELEGKSKEEYTLISTYSLYMFAKYSDNPSSKNCIKLANMELTKYLAVRKIKAEELPGNVYELYRKLMLTSDMHEELLKSLNEQKVLAEEKKMEYICLELMTLKRYPETINELLKLTLENLKKGKEAKLAYETYQRMITLLLAYYFSNIKEPAEIKKLDIKSIWEARDKLALSQDIYTLDTVNPANTLIKVFETFISIAAKGKDPSVSLNESRGAYLLILFGLHKLMLFSFKSDLIEKCKEISEIMLSVMQNYIKHFSTTGSIYSEIIPYCVDIEKEQREELIKTAKEAKDLLNKPEADYNKYLVATILYYRLRVSLSNQTEFNTLLEEVLGLYKEAIIKIDKKLEKGERHPADDLLLIADYILQLMDKDIITPITVIRIILLKQGLKSSAANFDIKIQLLKILMMHNLKYMTREVYDDLNIKAVLTETLAHIYEKYLIEFAQIDKLGKVVEKFYKFIARNVKGVEVTKVKALKEGNFVQAEEFYNYEQHHTRSYHKIVLNTVTTLFEYAQNVQTKGISLFADVGQKIKEHLNLLKTPQQLIKSSDVYSLQQKIKSIPSLSHYQTDIKNTFTMSIDQPLDNLILDPILLPYMPLGKTNYREGISNVFGIFELPEFILLLHTLCTIVIEIHKNPSAAIDLKSFENAFENYKVTMKGVSKVFDEYKEDLNDMLNIFEYNGLMLNCISITKNLSSSKDQDSLSKEIEALSKVLESVKSKVNDIEKILKYLLEKKVEGAIHPLMERTNMRRFIGVLIHFGIHSNLLFTLIKTMLPSQLGKKKDEPGKALKKTIVDLKKQVAKLFNDSLNICQKFKVTEDVIGEFPLELSKVEMIGELLNDKSAKEIVKNVREGISDAIDHLEIVFRPMLKALTSIEI